jgi:hypothetical protein
MKILLFQLAMHTHVIHMGNEIKVLGELNDLTIYSSNFADLKQSKVKYRVKKKDR